jgi:ABC-type nitrate/sulfonate/bicarbonate transport system substrate-binding protein
MGIVRKPPYPNWRTAIRHFALTCCRSTMIGVTQEIRSKTGMPDAVRLHAGFATIGQGAGPMMVTAKAGLFKKYGLEVDTRRLMDSAKGVIRGLLSGEIQFGNMAAPAPLRANLRGEADLIFLTGGINQQFIMGRPGIASREELAGKKIGFVGDGGLNDALVRFIIEKLEAAGILGIHEEQIPSGGDQELAALSERQV